jgi:RHS repeat-associated protein
MNLNRSLYADFGYETLDGYGTRYTGGYKGLLTGTITAVLNTDTRLLPTRLYSVSDYDYIIGGGKIDPVYLYSVLYYDYKGQLIQSQSSNHLDGREKEYFAYNFTGQPTKKKHVHSASGQNTQTEVYTYEYDHSGRLLTTKHQLNSDAEVVLAENTYDELGRLKTTQAAGKASLKQTYGYNIRSWLKSLSGQLFSERLYYNEVFGEGTGYYNGNIATMTQGWDSPYIGYNYFYDLFSRLTRARSFFIQNGNNSYIEAYDTYYGYDKNGNITYLNRMEDWGYIDELEMFYDGNHLSWTRELGDWLGYEWAEGGFVDYSPTQGSIYGGLYYEYNANGGLKKDPFKGAEYTYNYLNLLSHVSVPAIVGRIDYQHTATGKKLKAFYEWCPSYSLNPLENTGGKAMLEGSCTLSRRITDYAGNLIYENGNLKRILTENGYIENGLYYFYLKDHLGNNNMIADANGQGRQFNFYYPYGLTSTNESANLDKQPYKFGGKEYETMHGLNLYDFEARPYDPILGRFLTPDPLAEKCPWINPYAYCNNNPVNYIDPTGMSTHTDSLGHVVNVYDDGDLNVYRHNTWDPANYSKDNTSAGGELMGETEYWDEFSPIYAEQNEDGSLGQFTIQFGKSFDPIIERMHKEAQGMDLIDIATTSRPNGFFDIKKNYKDIGALLNGRYVSSRSAGNYLAGYNASGAKLEFLQLYVSGEKKAGLGTGISFTTFQKLAGALHVNESLSPSEMTTIVLIGKSYGPAPTYGEQPYQYRMSKKGWNHGKKK